MRVITGIARGTRLKSLDGNDVRPTGEKVKEAVFSAIQFDIEGRRVLDLFGGCGQLGIEALSRGAEFCVFTDSSNDSVGVIKSNLSAARLTDRAQVVRKDFKMYLSSCNREFDIAFIDPPYHAGLYLDALSLTEKVMSEYGVIICEHPVDVDVPQTVGRYSVSKEYCYGKVCVTLYRLNKAEGLNE